MSSQRTQQLPCIAEMYGLELTFNEGRTGAYKTIELWVQFLDPNDPVILTNYNKFNRDKIPALYEKMKEMKFRLPSLADFTASLLSIMRKYDEGGLPVIELKESKPRVWH